MLNIFLGYHQALSIYNEEEGIEKGIALQSGNRKTKKNRLRTMRSNDTRIFKKKKRNIESKGQTNGKNAQKDEKYSSLLISTSPLLYC